MAIKNGDIADADDIVNSIGRISSFDANRILKADPSTFVNLEYSGADDFTDSNGVMNTVDTTASTATYDTVNTQYILGFTDEASGDTTHDPNTAVNPENAFDADDGTYANRVILGIYSLGKTFTSKFIASCKFKTFVNASDSGGGASGTMYVYVETFNGSTWDIQQTYTKAYSWGGGGGTSSFSKELTIPINVTCQGIRLRIGLDGSARADNSYVRWYTLEYGDYNLTNTVETNTILNVGVPKIIFVYAEDTTPTNTSITVDVSDDGGETFGITGGSIGTGINTEALTGSDLALKFNLVTTDTSVSPTLLGYGVSIVNS